MDGESIRREAIAQLQHAIGFDRWCWPNADPMSLLPLSGYADHDYGPRVPRLLELEYSSDGFAAKHRVARSPQLAASLSAETAGDLARSARWDEVMRPVGIGDVAAVACRDRLGSWGWIEAYRNLSDRPFEEEDLELLASVGRYLAPALRRDFAAGVHADGAEPGPSGVMLLDSDLRVLGWTAPARAWLDALPAASLFAQWGIVAPIVYPVATRARSSTTAASARAVERTIDRGLVVIEAAPMSGDGDDRIAVTLRGATPSETFDLLCRAYALTRRERDVVRAVLTGLDTRAITERLFISPYTLQDHLKAVFDKIGVHSRRELPQHSVPPPTALNRTRVIAPGEPATRCQTSDRHRPPRPDARPTRALNSFAPCL
jgi:DNA-binding CsgD family transcriptional regulator